MTDNTAEKLLSVLFDSRMFQEGDRITFSIPAQAMKETIKGNPNHYKLASALMAAAERSATHEERA